MDPQNEVNVSHETESTEEVEQNTEQAHEGGEQSPQTLADLVDLSKYERVKLGDREMSRDELQRGIMFQSDYTKKTQEIAQERKYFDNLQQDLLKVSQHPALATEFRRIYPSKFHGYLDLAVREANGAASGQKTVGQNQNAQDPRLEELFTTVKSLQSERYEEKVSQASQEIDTMISKLQPKYPLADESRVLAKVQSALSNGETMDAAKWERIFKEAHAHYEKAYKDYYKTINNNQKAAHVRGKDIAAGGGVPSGAPNMPKTLKDATKLALDNLNQK